MSIEDTIRQVVCGEVRTVVREEIRAVLGELLKPRPAADTLLTVEQVAQRVGGVKPVTVREWIRTGKLEARRAGHRFVVSPQALEAFLEKSAAAKRELGTEEHLSLLVSRIEAPTRNKK